MSTETVPRHARFAVSVLFLANGALFANVVPRLPDIRAELDLSNSALGTALAASPVGALSSGLVAGALVARIGSGRLAVACAVAYGAVLSLVGVAPAWAAFAGALLLIGALDSVMDVAMNAHGLRVQARYRRSLINGFHAWWSIGAVLGGLVGTAAAAADVPVTVHLATAGMVLAAMTVGVARWLLPGPGEPPPGVAPSPGAAAAPGATLRLLVRALGLLGVMTLLAAMVEDVPASWSAVYLRDGLGADAGSAGMGYVAFAAAMTSGRLVNDRLVERLGEVTVARAGAAAAALGLGTGLVVGTVPAAVAGLAVAGLGASSLYPALFHAAGSRPGVRSGDGIAFVSWVGRLGFLLGPPLVGVIADAYGLQRGLFVAVAAATLVALSAGVLAPPSRSPMTTGSRG